MDQVAFQGVLDAYLKSTTEEKINIYVNSQNLTQDQYHQLLKLYPLEALDQLEAALA